MKPKRSKADRLEFAKRMTRRFVPGIHCYKIGPSQYWVKRRGCGFNSFQLGCGFARAALEAWESALRHYIAGILSRMYWRASTEKMATFTNVYFGFDEMDAQTINGSVDPDKHEKTPAE